MYEIKPAESFTEADLNWNNQQSSLEMNDQIARPAIATSVEDIAQYDTVSVGFPIWWYQAPRIVQTFLESCDLSGKTVIPFATSGGSGMSKTAAILRKSCPAAKAQPGRRLSGSVLMDKAFCWVKSQGL